MNDGTAWSAAVAVAAVAVVTLAVGAWGLRLSRTTSDFYVAGRAVSARWNASAIGGEYLSAASFLGVAGLILGFGADMLWYPIGYTAGYLVLLTLVAAPLRRSGAYTLPDFAQLRLGSIRVRRVCAGLVVVIGWLYLLPQFQGAGLTLHTVTGAPGWVGTVVVAGVVLLNVVAGGMRSVTVVQALQYWLKLTAIAVPAVVLLMAWHGDGAPDPVTGDRPVARQAITVTVPTDTPVHVWRTAVVGVDGVLDSRPVSGQVRLTEGDHRFGAGTVVRLASGAPVPVSRDIEVVRDVDDAGPGTEVAGWAATGQAGARDHPLYRTYSLLLALLFGTMGLPHVLVRFYTNPDGHAARRTTVVVIGLLGLFYLFPPIYGALGRLYAPDLLLSGQLDTVVLLLPGRMLDGAAADAVTALITAGAFAAFLSTASGLTVAVSGVLSQDLLRGRMRGNVAGFRRAAVIAVAVPAVLSLLAQRVLLADTVGLAFALAASTFCPLLVLGIWWRRLTSRGALAGLAVGGTLSCLAVAVTLGGRTPGFGPPAVWAQPAAWTVPLAFLAMIVASLVDAARARRRGMTRAAARRLSVAGPVMVMIHTPEGLDVPPDSGRRR